MPYEEFNDTDMPEYNKDDIKPDDNIREIADTIDSDTPESTPEENLSDISILDDETSVAALGLLKQILSEKGCKLFDYKIGFGPTGFDIKGVHIKCRDPKQIMDSLKDVESLPGQVKPQGLFHKMPNTYAVIAILDDFKRRANEDLGLSIRAASYQNDYIVLSFMPAEEEQVIDMTDMGMPAGGLEAPLGGGGLELEPEESDLDNEIPGSEMPEETGLEEPESETPEEPETPEVKIPKSGVKTTDIDWGALGL